MSMQKVYAAIFEQERKVRQELHELIDNLDVNAASIDVTTKKGANGDAICSEYSTIYYVKKLLKSKQGFKKDCYTLEEVKKIKQTIIKLIEDLDI